MKWSSKYARQSWRGSASARDTAATASSTVSTTNPDKTVDTVTYDPAGNVTAQASLDTNGTTVLASTSATYDGEGDKTCNTDGHCDLSNCPSFSQGIENDFTYSSGQSSGSSERSTKITSSAACSAM